jgi:hypothetical protein
MSLRPGTVDNALSPLIDALTMEAKSARRLQPDSLLEMTALAELLSPSHPRERTGNDEKRWVSVRRRRAAQGRCGALTCTFAPDS